MEQVKLYDTTLRDGMGGQGMSLSVGEKLKVVAGPRRARRPVHRGRLSRAPTRRRRSSSSGSPSSSSSRRRLRLRHDPPPRHARRRGRGAAVLVGSFAPVVSLVGKTWGLHLEKVTRVSREENLAMIADSVAFCRDRGQAGRSSTPSTSSTATATTPATRSSACAAAADAGAENVTLCDTNGGSLPRLRRRGDRGRRRRARRRGRDRDPHPQRRRVRGRQLARRGRSRRAPRAGHRQRLRRALRQRQPGLDPARAAAEDGLRGGHARSSSQR